MTDGSFPVFYRTSSPFRSDAQKLISWHKPSKLLLPLTMLCICGCYALLSSIGDHLNCVRDPSHNSLRSVPLYNIPAFMHALPAQWEGFPSLLKDLSTPRTLQCPFRGLFCSYERPSVFFYQTPALLKLLPHHYLLLTHYSTRLLPKGCWNCHRHRCVSISKN